MTAIVTLVCGDTLEGLYINKTCVYQERQLNPFKLLYQLRKHGILDFSILSANQKWLYEKDTLPINLEEVEYYE